MLLVAMHDKSKRKTGTAKLDSSFNNWVAYSIRVGEVAGIRQPGGQVVVGGPKMVIILLYTVLWTKQMVVGGPYKMANTYVGG